MWEQFPDIVWELRCGDITRKRHVEGASTDGPRCVVRPIADSLGGHPLVTDKIQEAPFLVPPVCAPLQKTFNQCGGCACVALSPAGCRWVTRNRQPALLTNPPEAEVLVRWLAPGLASRLRSLDLE